MKEVTEPWKSMNLPIDGAVVEVSDSDSLILRFAAIQPDDYGLPHAAVRQAMVDAGWGAEDDDVGATKECYLTKGDQELTLTTLVKDGRPVLRLSI